MLKPGHYDLLYPRQFLDEADDFGLLDNMLNKIYYQIEYANETKKIQLVECKHTFE